MAEDTFISHRVKPPLYVKKSLVLSYPSPQQDTDSLLDLNLVSFFRYLFLLGVVVLYRQERYTKDVRRGCLTFQRIFELTQGKDYGPNTFQTFCLYITCHLSFHTENRGYSEIYQHLQLYFVHRRGPKSKEQTLLSHIHCL